MARRLIWSPRARRDLHDILDFIAKDSQVHARSVARRMLARAEALPEQPGQGRRVPEYEGRDEIREVFVHSWRVIYRTTDGAVTIVAIVHAARLLKNSPPL